MAETDPGSPEPSQNPDPAKSADGLKVVPELDLSRGERSRTAAVARALEPTRALVERWRLTPDGRVRDAEAGEVDRVVAASMHMWPILAAVLGPAAPLIPLVLWLAFRSRSPLIDDHGREVVNAILTLLILLCVPCLGWVVLLAWVPVQLVSLVRGAVAGGSGELFRYPAILRAVP
ncbi:MAG: DUF4870 domain-containing protein [Planctomycetota bacterium]|nr:DUF4870 domain-containing protein [Planctomycetota bacterium]